MELIRQERIHRRKLIRTVKFPHFIAIALKYDSILDARLIRIVQGFERTFSDLVLLQNSFPDNLIRIDRGQGKPRLEPALNLGEVVLALHAGIHVFHHGIDVFLCSDNNPCFSMATRAELFRHRLKVQHQAGICADELPDLIHQKDHSLPGLLNILVHPLGKILNGDFIIGRRSCLGPVHRFLLGHTPHGSKGLRDLSTDHAEFVPLIKPLLAV